MKSKSLSEDSLINKLKKENFIYKSISSEFNAKENSPEKLKIKTLIEKNKSNSSFLK